jgi:RNA methyltransferase, TrmH family
LARDLRRRKAREKHTRCVIEGVRAVEELLASASPIVGVLVGPELQSTPRGSALFAALTRHGVPIHDVTPDEFASAADTEAPQGVLAVAPIPLRSLDTIPATGTVVILDGVQDPGNVGTILRTAAALDAAATIALPGTVDLFNAKVIRSAVGAQFRHHALHADWDEVQAWLATAHLPLWVAALEGTPVRDVTLPPRVALAMGNEGAGVSAAVRAAAARSVAIPISDRAESLNVAVATGILLYLLRR